MTTPPDRAAFRSRDRCITCGSRDFSTLASGRFSEDPLRSFIEADPWGESPLPYLGDHPWEYLQCSGCGQMFHRWLLSPDWQEVRFSRWMSPGAIREFEAIRGLDSPRSRFDRGVARVRHILRIEKMTRSIRGDDAVRLLDYGCGWGEFPAQAAALGFEAYGVDRSAGRRDVSKGLGVTVAEDLGSLPVEGGFHAVTLFQVLEHAEEPLSLLRGLHRRMVPGAVLVLEVPDCEGILGIAGPSDYYAIHPLEHPNAFTGGSLREIAGRAGFRPARPAVAHATADASRVLRGVAGRWIRAWKSPGTNRYFIRN